MCVPNPAEPRGSQINFVTSNDLLVLDDPQSPPTFVTPYAETWIDIILATKDVICADFDGQVLDTPCLSDHQ